MGSLRVRDLSGLALVAGAGILVAACATDGKGGTPGRLGSEGPGNSTQHPGNSYEAPENSYDGPGANGTQRPAANCTATLGDLLDVYADLCEFVEECFGSGNNTTDPPEDDDYQQSVHGKVTARTALDHAISLLPLTRTRGNAEGPQADDLVDSCESIAECRAGGCAPYLNETVIDKETGICVGTVINCIRAVFNLIPCDGDLSSLDLSNPPVACQGLTDNGSSTEEGTID